MDVWKDISNALRMLLARNKNFVYNREISLPIFAQGDPSIAKAALSVAFRSSNTASENKFRPVLRVPTPIIRFFESKRVLWRKNLDFVHLWAIVKHRFLENQNFKKC